MAMMTAPEAAFEKRAMVARRAIPRKRPGYQICSWTGVVAADLPEQSMCGADQLVCRRDGGVGCLACQAGPGPRM
jgi:hypothetical protein